MSRDRLRHAPLAWDSDGDMLPDGWELQYGLSPCECATTNSPAWDADNDGLGLFDEYRYCTSPFTPDTDGDGVRDGDEAAQGSDPADASDGGDPANCVKLRLTVGDPSGSESERWNLDVFEEATGRAVCHHCDNGFGTPGSAEYSLVKGKAYAFSLRWVATNLDDGPDYDWRAKINYSTAAGAYSGLYGTGAFIVEDPDGLLTECTYGGPNNLTIGKQGRIIVPKVEITPSAATVIEGADSGDFEAIVTPTGLSGLTYEWEWEAYAASGNTPSVTYTAPNAAKTQVERAHWYAFPNDRCEAGTVCAYRLRCTVRIGDVACSSSAQMSVQLVDPAARTEPKYEITGGATVAYDATNQLWYVAGTGSLSRQVVITTDWWLHANSEFTAKLQAHENQHSQDFINGFDGHTFVTVPEFYARISSLVDPTPDGLVSKITAEYVQYMSDEEAELLSLVDGLEVRAYNVSDGVDPDYVFSNCGRFTYP